MMMMETKNNIWGETRNPLNKHLSAGGSTGGEAALIAMRGLPLGIGTEIGGSLRHPAAWTHLYGLKSSTERFPIWGLSDRPSSVYLLAITGPMSRSLKTINVYYEAMLSEQAAPWTRDPNCIPIPWRRHVIQPKGRKLRIGIIGSNDGLVTVHPPIDRAIQLTRLRLEEAGHEVFDWEPIEHPALWENLTASLVDVDLDAIKFMLSATGELSDYPSLKPFLDKASTAIEGGLSPLQLRTLNFERQHLQKSYLDQWQSTATSEKMPMDCIIMAASPWAACRRGTVEKMEYFGYAGVLDPLDLPACTFPVTFADKKLDHPRKEFTALSELDKLIQADYDPEVYDGAPVSLQLVGRRLEEEKVLEMVEVVANLL